MTNSEKALPSRANEHICFAIYSAGHAFNRAYRPMLKELGLTYPQYIVLTVLWEKDNQTVGALCEYLKLDTGTLTPLLKRLEKLGHIERKRGALDERQVFVSLTQSGHDLQKQSGRITKCIIESTEMDLENLEQLVHTISQLRDSVLAVSTKTRDV